MNPNRLMLIARLVQAAEAVQSAQSVAARTSNPHDLIRALCDIERRLLSLADESLKEYVVFE